MKAYQALQHPWIKKPSADLTKNSLQASKEELRKHLIRRKFRKAVLTSIAVNRFRTHYVQ